MHAPLPVGVRRAGCIARSEMQDERGGGPLIDRVEKAWPNPVGLVAALQPGGALAEYDFVWSLESDVAYTGDWGAMLQAFDHAYPSVDLLTSGNGRRPLNTSTINPAGYVGADWGAKLEEAGYASAGVWKALVFVIRLSKRLAQHARAAADAGAHAYLEFHWATLCKDLEAKGSGCSAQSLRGDEDNATTTLPPGFALPGGFSAGPPWGCPSMEGIDESRCADYKALRKVMLSDAWPTGLPANRLMHPVKWPAITGGEHEWVDYMNEWAGSAERAFMVHGGDGSNVSLCAYPAELPPFADVEETGRRIMQLVHPALEGARGSTRRSRGFTSFKNLSAAARRRVLEPAM